MSDDGARVEAERRNGGSGGWDRGTDETDERLRAEFVAGAAWQAAQPVVVSAEQVEAARDEVNAGSYTWLEQGAVRALLAALDITTEPTP